MSLPPDHIAPDFISAEMDSVRKPPQSVEGEQAILGSLLLGGGAFDRVAETVNENDFYLYSHRLIFRAIAALAAANQPTDVVTVVDWLDSRALLEDAEGLHYIGALAEETPSAENIVTYAEIVRERSVKRQLIAVANDIADSAFSTDGQNSKELLDVAEEKVLGIANQSATAAGGFIDITSVLSTAVDKINFLFQNKEAITGLSTGFDDLDELTSGLQPSDLVIVAGRPSMGKTTFAMNIAEYAALEAKAPVAVFSMEMPADQLAMRMIASLGRVELNALRTGRLSEQDWSRIISAITLLNEKRNIFIDDSAGLTPTDCENRTNEISEISRSLKAIAKELEVPVIALSQLNRSLEQRPDKRPVMSDLRESGAIEQDADVIMFIYRDEVYNPDAEDNKGKAEVLIRKQRNGPIGSVDLTFLGKYTRFENYSPEVYSGEFS